MAREFGGEAAIMRAIRIHQSRPDVMRLEEVELPPPRPGEARIRHRAIGVNYLDVYYRTGFYPPPPYPFTPGNQGAGEIVAMGKDFKGFRPGDRVAYVSTLGSYAEARNVEAKHLVKLPKSISYAAGSGDAVKGLTAQYLLRQTYKVKKGDVILVHAAAGGVGQSPVPMGQGARRDGDRHRRLRGEGQDRQEMRGQARHSLPRGGFRRPRRRDHQRREMPRRLRRRRQATFPASLDCLRPFGMFASFGSASGRYRLVQSRVAGAKRLAVRHPADALHLCRRPRAARKMARELFAVVASGKVNIPPPTEAPPPTPPAFTPLWRRARRQDRLFFCHRQ